MNSPARPEVGKERYLSHSKGIGGKLRKIPEDFIVEEIRGGLITQEMMGLVL